jgi:ABC-type Mn2+/Zn2+ transport system permease subunit
MLHYLIEPFSFPFIQKAFLAIIFSSFSCSLVGTYVVLRRMSFMGEALTHTILPGVVFAYLKQFEALWGAFFASILTAIGIGYLSTHKSIREDTAIGISLSFMFALGILMMNTMSSYRDFSHILFGSPLSVSTFELYISGFFSLLIFIVLGFLHKELELASYDFDYSSLIGIQPNRLRLVLLILVALSVVSAVQIIGTLLTTALLIIPPATACLWAYTLPRIMLVAALFSNAAGILGLYTSFYWNVSSGAAIVMWASAFFFLSWIVQKGIVFMKQRQL